MASNKHTVLTAHDASPEKSGGGATVGCMLLSSTPLRNQRNTTLLLDEGKQARMRTVPLRE